MATDQKPKHDPASQCARILARLKATGRMTNVELNRMGIFRYSARIKNLRDDGHTIVSNRIRDGLWEFVLTEEAKT